MNENFLKEINIKKRIGNQVNTELMEERVMKDWAQQADPKRDLFKGIE